MFLFGKPVNRKKILLAHCLWSLLCQLNHRYYFYRRYMGDFNKMRKLLCISTKDLSSIINRLRQKLNNLGVYTKFMALLTAGQFPTFCSRNLSTYFDKHYDVKAIISLWAFIKLVTITKAALMYLKWTTQ